MKIKNIIFDYGGVIIDLDYSATTRAFEAHGVKSFNAAFTQHEQHDLFDEFDCGRITPAAFRKQLNMLLQVRLTDTQIDQSWNAMLLGIRHEKLSFLKTLSEKYSLFLLSNTNEIHLTAVERYFENVYGAVRIENFFTECYYSCRIGYRKPQAECFQLILGKHGLRKDETIFIDDTPGIIHAARALGIPSHLYPTNESLDFFFKNRLATLISEK